MIIDKYVSLCPEYSKKENLYLQSLANPTPACWYAKEVLGTNSIGKIIAKLMESARYEGFYSGHSLRWTGSTRLFQAGVQRKIVKECTGHRSDAVDKYQITSDEQRETVSEIIASKPSTIQSQVTNIKKVAGSAIDAKVQIGNNNNVTSCEQIPSVQAECTTAPPSDSTKCDCKKVTNVRFVWTATWVYPENCNAKIKIEIELSKE